MAVNILSPEEIVDGTDPTTANHVINHVVSRSQAFGLKQAAKTAGHASSVGPGGLMLVFLHFG